MSTELRGKSLTVLMGGGSAERDISLKSGAAVADGLELAEALVTRIDTARNGWYLDLPADTFVFNLLHGLKLGGIYGERVFHAPRFLKKTFVTPQCDFRGGLPPETADAGLSRTAVVAGDSCHRSMFSQRNGLEIHL